MATQGVPSSSCSDEDDENDCSALNGLQLSDECGPDVRSILSKAYDRKIRPFIEMIDDLRRLGLDQDVSLPTVVVVGDQSSGKSSILEAISGVQLPRGAGIVTRCPLEMQLKRTFGKEWRATLSYMNSSNQETMIQCATPEEVERQISAAQNVLTGTSKGISPKVITLRVESPTAPDLTLIDLPGIARTAVEGQPKDISTQIKNMIRTYIDRPNSMILCVISANLDIAVNEAISLAQDVDPEGKRTLGVITKPDLVENSKSAKQDVIDLLNNQKVQLTKGFSMVKCRSYDELQNRISLQESLENEKLYFELDPVYGSVCKHQLGTHNLAERLTELLVELIQEVIPELKRDVREKLEDARQKMGNMPSGPPADQAGRLAFLFQMIYDFTKKLEKCYNQGEIIRTPKNPKPRNIFFDWRQVLQLFEATVTDLTAAALQHHNGTLTESSIKSRMLTQRGRELPRFMNYDLFEELVRDHVRQYKDPAAACLNKFSANLNETVERHAEVFANFPPLKGEVLEICESVREMKVEEAKDMLKYHFEQEELVYTQDNNFIMHLEIWEKEIQRKMQSDPKFRQRTEEELAAIPEEDKNARLMHHLIQHYLEVVNRRMADAIPCCFRVKLHMQYLKEVQLRLNKFIALPDTSELVHEPADIVARRQHLKDKIDRLHRAAMKLSRI